jgi:putative transposase
VIDQYARECPALVADTLQSGARMVRGFDRCCQLFGKPETIISDKGAELTSRAVLEWKI